MPELYNLLQLLSSPLQTSGPSPLSPEAVQAEAEKPKKARKKKAKSEQVDPQTATPEQLATVDKLSEVAPPTPEESDSIIGSALRTGISGLQWVGETLDKPGRAVRGLLAGQPYELLNLVPFSDSLGITDPNESVTGRDLLEKAGVLNENAEGLDVGDVAGFGTELVLDPLAFVSLFPKAVVATGAKGASKAASLLTRDETAKALGEGTASLLKLHTPDLTIPFTDIGLKAKPLHETWLGKAAGLTRSEFGSGPAAEEAYRAMWYSKYSPLAHTRKLFSTNPLINTGTPVKFMAEADRAWADGLRADADTAESAVNMLRGQQDATTAFQKLVEADVMGGVDNAAKMRAEAVVTASATSKRMQKAIAKAVKNLGLDPSAYQTVEQYVANPEVVARLDGVYDQAIRGMNGLGEVAADLKTKFTQVAEHHGVAMEGYPDVDWLNDSIRGFLEQRDPLTKQHIIERLQDKGLAKNLADYDQSIDTFYELADGIRGMYPKVHDELTKLGVDVPWLRDWFANYAHRSGTAKRGSKLAAELTKMRFRSSKEAMQQYRKDVLRHVPGNTETINRISMDPVVTAAYKNSKEAGELLDAEMKRLDMPNYYARPAAGSNLSPLYDAGEKEGLNFGYLQSLGQMEMRTAKKAAAHAKDMRAKLEAALNPGWWENGPFSQTIGKQLLDGTLDYTGIPNINEAAKIWKANHKGLTTNDAKQAVGDFVKRMFAEKGARPIDAPKWQDPAFVERITARVKGLTDQETAERAGLAFDADAAKMAPEDRAILDHLKGSVRVGGKKDGWTNEKAGVYLAQKYGIPTYFNREMHLRNALKERATDPFVRELADSADTPDEFKRNLLEYLQGVQKDLPPEQAWSWNYHKGIGPRADVPDTGDLDDFIFDLPNHMPELGGFEEAIRSQPDLDDLVSYYARLPKKVLETGLINRDAVSDAVSYLIQATRLKTAAAVMHRVVNNPEFVNDKVDGLPLREFWKSLEMNSSALHERGLAQALAKRDGTLTPDDVTLLTEDADELEKLLTQADGLKIDHDVARGLKNYYAAFKDPAKSNFIAEGLDFVQQMTQPSLTMPFPGFHTRNRFSGMMANWLSGIFSSKAERDTQDLFYGKNLDKSLKGPDGADIPLSEILREVVVHKLVPHGPHGAYDHIERNLRPLYEGISPTAPGASVPVGGKIAENRILKPWASAVRGPFGEVVETFKEAAAEGGTLQGLRQAAFGGVDEAGDARTGLLNLQSYRGGFDMGLARRRAGELDEVTGKPLGFMERAKVEETTNALFKAGENANAYVEFMNRVSPYVALRKAGWTPDAASRKVKEVQFDYSSLNEFEKKYLKRATLFYSFARKNMEQQLKLLLHNPGGRSAQLIRGSNRLRGEGEDGYTPKYLSEGLALRIPADDLPDGTKRFWSQTGLLPFEESFNRFSFDDSGFPLNVQRTTEKFLAQTNPVPQGILEQVTGKQFWSGRSNADLQGGVTGDSDVDFWLQKSPISRALTTYRTWTDERKDLGVKTFNTLFGGVRLTDVDVERQRLFDIRNALGDDLAEDADVGRYTTVYAKDMAGLVERAKAGDAGALKKLQVMQDLQEGLRGLKKERAQ